MLHRKSWTIIASVLTLAVAGSTAVGQTTYYVNGGCGDDAWTGLSDVCQAPDGPKATIQAAIGPVGSGAGNGDEIIVAPGSYNECINFNGKAITLRSSDGADVTTIDGTGLSCSLVKCENGEGSDTVLEGFTITGGGGTGSPDGGGMYNFNSSPTVSDCIFSQNITTLGNGGAVCNRQSNPIVTNCMFTGNTATDGGAMLNFGSSPKVSNCIFSNNHVIGGLNDFGGAIDNTMGSAPEIVNCLFTGNSSDHWGGAIANVASSNATIRNCTFAGNSADVTGGGLHIESDSTARIEHCIFWGNSDAGGTDESAQIHGDAPAVTCSCIQGCATFCSDPGDHNTGDDPLFASRPPPNEDEQWYLSQTASGQGVDSPCVDSGAGPVSAFYVMGTTRTDQVDDTGIVDLGYHYNATLAGPAIPTVSEWGMVLMSLLVLTAGTLVYGRRAPACP